MKKIVVVKPSLLLAMMMVMTTTTTTVAYAQLTQPGPRLDTATNPTVSDRIEAAESNTDIDLQRIDDILDTVSTEYISTLNEATFAGDVNAFSAYQNQIDAAMWDIHLELSYVTPEQVELLNVVENESATDTVLNVTFVDDSAAKIQEITGTLFAMFTFDSPTQNDIEAIMSRMQYHIQNMRNEISFSVPPEAVEIVGGMWVPIEELRALEAQLNPPSTLVLP